MGPRTQDGRARRRLVRGALVAAAMAAGTVAVAPARADEPLPTIVQDDAQLLHRSDAQTLASLKLLKDAGTSTVRVTAGWSVLAPDADSPSVPKGFDQTDPRAYEQARFAGLDRLVRMAKDQGLDVMIDIAFWAPRWATTSPAGPRARRDIDPAAYARFATAIARRYSGTFTPPAPAAGAEASSDDRFLEALYGDNGLFRRFRPARGTGPLPAVTTYTLWNEPNHPAFLRPQWAGNGADRHPASADIYRRMVAAAYPAVKAVAPSSRILVGGTAAQSSGTKGVAPLTFIRRLACVDEQLRPVTDGDCADFRPVPGDGWAHHPYALRTVPDAHAADPDHAPIGDLSRLTDLLARLVASGRLAPALANVWITEFGYEANPSDRSLKWSTGDQAEFLPWSEYLASRLPQVRSFAQFLLRDLPPTLSVLTTSARRSQGQWQSGLLFADGRPKLAYDAYKAGIFVRPAADGTFAVWGRIRTQAPGTLRGAALEMRPDGGALFTPLASVPTGGGAAVADFQTGPIVSRTISAPRTARFRLRYLDASGVWHVSPSVGLADEASADG